MLLKRGVLRMEKEQTIRSSIRRIFRRFLGNAALAANAHWTDFLLGRGCAACVLRRALLF